MRNTWKGNIRCATIRMGIHERGLKDLEEKEENKGKKRTISFLSNCREQKRAEERKKISMEKKIKAKRI